MALHRRHPSHAATDVRGGKMKRLLRWYMNFRSGYRAPSGGPVRCTRGNSVIYGELVADHGSYVQVQAEGSTVVPLWVPDWEIVRL